jgi:hypothetical protein
VEADKGEIVANDSKDPEGNVNLTSDRTGINIIPRLESAPIFIKGSIVEMGPIAAAPAPLAPLARPCP